MALPASGPISMNMVNTELRVRRLQFLPAFLSSMLNFMERVGVITVLVADRGLIFQEVLQYPPMMCCTSIIQETTRQLLQA